MVLDKHVFNLIGIYSSIILVIKIKFFAPSVAPPDFRCKNCTTWPVEPFNYGTKFLPTTYNTLPLDILQKKVSFQEAHLPLSRSSTLPRISHQFVPLHCAIWFPATTSWSIIYSNNWHPILLLLLSQPILSLYPRSEFYHTKWHTYPSCLQSITYFYLPQDLYSQEVFLANLFRGITLVIILVTYTRWLINPTRIL